MEPISEGDLGHFVDVSRKLVRDNARLVAVNEQLLVACKFALYELSDMTSDQFSLGEDKALRIRLGKAINAAEEV